MMVAPGTDWQLGCMDLKQRGAHLLHSGQWSDCSFLVGSEPEQVLITAHKLILASASPVFEAMFYGGMAEKDGPIEILDVQPRAFQILLQYIYTNETVITSFKKACSVYYTAKKYMLPYLVKECTYFISDNLSPKNVCRAYELAVLFDENFLIEKCTKIMLTQTKEVLANRNFKEADLNTVNMILSQELLYIESELDLFKAVEKYAIANSKHAHSKRSATGQETLESPPKKARLSQKDEEPNNSNEINLSVTKLNENQSKMEDNVNVTAVHCQNEQVENSTADVTQNIDDRSSDVNNNEENTSISGSQHSNICIDRGFVREAISKIRFLTLTAQQFAGGPARSSLLSESEAFAVLMNILSADSTVPMPDGFCTSRINRNQQTLATEAACNQSEAVFRFTVLNFRSRRRSVESRPFYCHELAWSLKLVPRVEANTNGQENKYFGLYLRCAGREGGAWACTARADMRLLAAPPHPHVAASLQRLYNSKELEWGFERFVSWADALDPGRGLLRGNSITVEVRLRVTSL